MIERLGTLKPCKWCASTWHTGMSCPTRRKPMNRGTSQLTTTKRMAPVGKQGKKTQAAVAAWKRTIKPNSDGLYQCHYCPNRVPYLMAEHMESKARRPDLRTDPKNFVPVCSNCNKNKGSKSHDEIPHVCNL